MAHRNCSKCGNSFFQRILELGVPAVCPQCSLIYSVAKSVSDSPKVPEGLRSAAGVVVIGLLFLGGLHLLDKTLKS